MHRPARFIFAVCRPLRDAWALAMLALALLAPGAWAADTARAQADLLAGRQALAADEPTRALMAFERCLIRQPHLDACRLGLARAHLLLSEFVQARQALRAVTDPGLRAQAQALAAESRRALSPRADAPGDGARFSAWVQAGVGYDSNANAATTADRVDLAPLTWIVLDPFAQNRASFFQQTALGLDYSAPLNARWQGLASATVRARQYGSAHDVDSIQASASAGVRYTRDGHRLTLRALGQYAGLGGHSYRYLQGASADYSYQLTDRLALGWFGQYFWMQYPGRRWMNAQRGILGLTGVWRWADQRALAYAHLYGGRESAPDDQAPDALSQDIFGGRLGVLWQASARTRLDAGVGYEHRRYDGDDALFVVSRSSPYYAYNQQYPMARTDRQVSAWLGANYAVDRHLSIRPRYEYIRVDSDLIMRTYHRHVIALDVRYAF
ncbi:surface lipoprotein assembly modifier [Castellaniella hirudinis]|uniref:surface lipoprotein assembly modifier n=1 Tax=Castellaniella hirudinis TaxID=1144617 RepID=UPI0039C40410